MVSVIKGITENAATGTLLLLASCLPACQPVIRAAGVLPPPTDHFPGPQPPWYTNRSFTASSFLLMQIFLDSLVHGSTSEALPIG